MTTTGRLGWWAVALAVDAMMSVAMVTALATADPASAAPCGFGCDNDGDGNGGGGNGGGGNGGNGGGGGGAFIPSSVEAGRAVQGRIFQINRSAQRQINAQFGRVGLRF